MIDFINDWALLMSKINRYILKPLEIGMVSVIIYYIVLMLEK